mmetsp:Transcript_10325/g.24610  ORF Transcript_10325/g.24610 Transcript_10325/m.24610 type:complete len:107 (+) Transcript_10325:738-1058(+)
MLPVQRNSILGLWMDGASCLCCATLQLLNGEILTTALGASATSSMIPDSMLAKDGVTDLDNGNTWKEARAVLPPTAKGRNFLILKQTLQSAMIFPRSTLKYLQTYN